MGPRPHQVKVDQFIAVQVIEALGTVQRNISAPAAQMQCWPVTMLCEQTQLGCIRRPVQLSLMHPCSMGYALRLACSSLLAECSTLSCKTRSL